MYRGVLGVCIALALAACGDDGGGEVVETCASDPVLDVTFDLDTTNPSPQIHADFAFVGGDIWMAYNLVDGEGGGGFDVFLSRLGCDGSVGPAERVTTTMGGNDIEPEIDRRGDRVFITWSSDTSAAENNLAALFRGYTTDGTPLTASDTTVQTELDGQPVIANTWLPEVTGLPNGDAAIIGVRGIDTSFQTFIQRISADGNPQGEAIDVTDRGNGHNAPTIASANDGGLFTAWQRDDGNGDVVWYGFIPAGASGFSVGPVAATTTSSAAPSLAVDRSSDTAYLAVWDDTADDIVLIALNRDGEIARTSLGAAAETDFSPVVVTSSTGGAVGWYRNVSGIRNRFVVQRFDFDGTSFDLGDEHDLGTLGAVSVYSPALIHIGDDMYFGAWSEGDAPDFFVKGRAVDTR